MNNPKVPSKKIILWAITAILVLASAGGVAWAMRQYNRPLADQLSLQTTKNQAVVTANVETLSVAAAGAGSTNPAATGAEPGSAIATTPAVTETIASSTESQAQVCGERGTMILLFAGIDFADGDPPRGADAVRLARVDFSARRLDVVAFPRDLWVHSAEFANGQRLGLVYYYTRMNTPGSQRDFIETATNALAQALADNFGVAPQHYITVQLDGLVNIVDTLGGVTIDLPQAIHTRRGINFPAGVQTLNGQQAADFLRMRMPGGEAARLKRQNLFLEALRSKLITPAVLPKLPSLVEQLNSSVVTDLSLKQLKDLACLVNQVPDGQYTFYEIGDTLATAGENNMLIPKTEEIRKFLEGIFAPGS